MYKLTSDLFREAVEKFATVESATLTQWASACDCPEPGMRTECYTCPYYKKLGQLVQQKIDPVKKLGLATIRPVKHSDPYTDKVKQQCIAMYQLGYSVNEIQELNGIPLRRTLRGWLRTSGLPGRSVKLSEDAKQTCIQLYLDGWTPREIEEQTDISADTITDLVHTEGIARKTRYPEEVKQRSLKLYKKGKTAAQVAEITGAHPVTIYSWIAEAGLGGKQKRYSKTTIDTCLRLYREGNSPQEISALTTVNVATIRSWITKASLIKVKDGDQVEIIPLLPPIPSQPITRPIPERKPVGQWKDFNNLKQEIIALNEIRGAVDMVPTAQELQQMKRGDLQKAISKFHGGYIAVAEKLAWSSRRRTNGYWLDFANLKDELVTFIEHHGTQGVMPTKEELQAAQPSLAWAIQQHGGFVQVAQRLNLELSYSRKPRSYWKRLDNLKREILEVVEQLGLGETMPMHEELTQIGRKDLINAIADNGGWPSVAKRIGLTYVRNYSNPNDH